MRTVVPAPRALSFSLAVCSALLTSCGTNTLDDVVVTAPDAKSEPVKEDPAKPTIGNFERWMKCMKLSDFRTAGMVNAWNEIVATGNTYCVNCHENGADGFIVTPNEQKFFDAISKDKLYALEYFTYSALEMPFTVSENQIAMTGVSTSLDPHREHPRFNPAAGLAASRQFAMLTQAGYNAAAGDCAP
jgi:hypothetical protein